MQRIAAAAAAITVIAAMPAGASTYLYHKQPDRALSSAEELQRYAPMTDADVSPMARLGDLSPNYLVDTWSPGLVFFADQSRNQGQAARSMGAVRDQRRYISNFRVPIGPKKAATDRPGQHRLVALDVLSLSAVPEPQSWALMIAGFGMIGAALRRRRVVATAA